MTTVRGGGIGPGTMRVGRFIGRLGVVSLPAVQVGLDLDDRVVRRHVANLEAAGWLARAPWLWGEGSITWLTFAGIEATGLGGVRAVASPPAPTTIAHGVLTGWSAARSERLDNRWAGSRELAIDHERWAIPVRGEHRRVTRLPDLAIWRPGDQRPAAIIAEIGGRRRDRQKAILEAWRDAILSDRYSMVRCDCASVPVADSITRLARRIGLSNSVFLAREQTTAAEIAALPGPARTEPAEGASAQTEEPVPEGVRHRCTGGTKASIPA
jgi:hypothetical protein